MTSVLERWKLPFGLAFIFLHVISGSMAQNNTTIEITFPEEPENATVVTTTINVNETTVAPTTIHVVSTLATETTKLATVPVTLSTAVNTNNTNGSSTTTNTSTTTETSTVLNSTSSVPIIQLNVTSIVETINDSNRSQDIIKSYNMTTEMFFTNVADYTLAQSDETVNKLLNTTTGQLLKQLLETDSSLVLGNFSNTISATARRVFFYAALLDFEENIESQEFVEIFINAINDENSTEEYSLDEERLRSRACKEFRNAGGDSSFCTTSTASPSSDTDLGLIIGCSVAGGVLCLVVISIGIACLCKNQSSSKVTPSQNGAEVEHEQFNENGMQSQISMSNHYDTDS